MKAGSTVFVFKVKMGKIGEMGKLGVSVIKK
jgi:hypothetical protein